MKKRRIEGWLFDVDELGAGIALWVYEATGALRRLTHEFRPPVYVGGDRDEIKRLSAELWRRGIVSGGRWQVRREFWSGREIDVLQLNVRDSSDLPRLREIAGAMEPAMPFYNIDIPTAQYYLYGTGLFPLCRLECETDEAGNVLDIAATNSAYDLHHEAPPLSVLRMRGERMQPFSARSRLLVEWNGETTVFPLMGAGVLAAFNRLLERANPDLILSEQGDTVLFPALLTRARGERIDLRLDRDRVKTQRRIETEGRTYTSYGQVIYKGPSYPLFGRWHIDRRNSFAYHETELEGLLELARLSQMPVQRTARRSPGTAMTSIQLGCAVREGILVPWRKSEPERYKTALQLLTVDKGGLTYQPRIGAFEGVAEIDYASMYPSLMVAHNISPETVLCGCCENRAVPEAGYNICTKRRGLIPRTLAPLVERRRRLKELQRSAEDDRTRAICEARRAAIKWMLVSCFGYLGFRNAKFGRIEAHESVTAFGRETLLQAKDRAEAEGFRMLHALTDSLWISKAGTTEAELQALCRAITAETQVEMSLEGVYRWIVFLSSKVKEGRPVPSRYFGVFSDGTLKTRGLAHRRRDTPRYVKDVQEEMLAILAEARTLVELREKRKEAQDLLERRIGDLERGEVPLRLLLIEQVLSRAPEEYAVETRAALAARRLREAGLPIHAGERVGYVIADAKARDKTQRVSIGGEGETPRCDVKEYARRLRDAGREICSFGLPPEDPS
ncbi:MAG: DNA polymerase domain-containing protein [Blastocatellia bacterium]|nr:DNA polymerase domain-containing protein [Blastocatellia bacterium]